MVKLVNYKGSYIDAVVSVLSKLHESIGDKGRRLNENDIIHGLMQVSLSPIDYGVVDLGDAQHVELFYLQILRAIVGFQVQFGVQGSEALQTSGPKTKSELERWKAQKVDEEKLRLAVETERKRLDGTYFSMIIAGAGSSASYFLNTLGETYDHTGTLLIGDADAWTAGKRGVGLLNHEEQNVAQWGDKAPRFSTEYLERDALVDQNRTIRTRAILRGMKHNEGKVTKIEYTGKDDPIFKVTAEGKAYTTNRVVVCLGAGPHLQPAQLAGFTVVGKPKRLVDLDTFMIAFPPDAKAKGTVVVHGPNAGIDAVERARCVGFDVLWFIRNTQPVLLKGNRLQHAPDVATVSVDDVTLQPGTSDDKVAVAGKFQSKTVDLGLTEVDWYVYALGQDPFAPGAIGRVIDPAILNDLVPIEDPNQSYETYGVKLPTDSTATESGKGTTADSSFGVSTIDRDKEGVPTFRTQDLTSFVKKYGTGTGKAPKHTKEQLASLNVVVGLQVVGSDSKRGLRIMGAGAYQIVFEPKGLKSKDDLAPYAEVAKRFKATLGIDNTLLAQAMDGQARFEVRSVVVPPQLATVKSAIGALGAMMPSYITQEVNFSQDNPTMLRTHIASKYPNVAEDRAEEIIAAILVHRRYDYHPIGYDAWWQMHWRHVLEYWNAPSKDRTEVEKRQQKEMEALQHNAKGLPGWQTAD